MGQVEAQGFDNHERSKKADGSHGTVFQPAVLFDLIDSLDREFTHDNCADPVSDQNQSDVCRESERSEDAVNAEGKIQHFEEEQLCNVAGSLLDFALLLFRLLTKSEQDEKHGIARCRGDHGQRLVAYGPHDSNEQQSG